MPCDMPREMLGCPHSVRPSTLSSPDLHVTHVRLSGSPQTTERRDPGRMYLSVAPFLPSSSACFPSEARGLA